MTKHVWRDVPGSDISYNVRGGLVIHRPARECSRCGYDTSQLTRFDSLPPEDCDATLVNELMHS